MPRHIPMLFKAEMINAILDGRKTETRRLFKDAPPDAAEFVRLVDDGDSFWWCVTQSKGFHPHHFGRRTMAGDLIWAREAWRVGAWRTEQWSRGKGECDADIAVDYLADNHARKEWIGGDPEMMMRLVEQSRDDAEADGRFKQGEEFEYRWQPGQSPCRGRPSLHMPKQFSRLTLRVTDYRIERLHAIDEKGAWAEGCTPADEPDDNGNPCPAEVPHKSGKGLVGWDCALDWYADLWDDINGAGSWDADPWVTVTQFEVIKQNILEVS